ncbi:sensor histidine kinase [Flavitalea flava]
MKLFTKYGRVNIIASILALLVGSIGYYLIIRSVLINQLDNTLKIEEEEILDFVRTKDQMPAPANYRDQQIRFAPATAPVQRKFIHTSYPDKKHPDRRHHEDRPFRQLLFSVTAGGHLYTVSVGESETETEDLLELIMLVTAGMILLLLGTLFLGNRLLLRRIWQPFYHTLEGIRQFNLSSRHPPAGQDTDIEEFKNLDRAVEQMTQKILKDYEILKNFADNASHEMQTPLAIINSKLDLMIQDPGLSEKHLRQLQAMYDAVGRLSKLNQSLLLLTKIENNQFTHSDQVDLCLLIESKLSQLEDLIGNRKITVHTHMNKVCPQMNTYLADILLNNLLGNAIRHNLEGGRLEILLEEDKLQIGNTGPDLQLDADSLFDRFTKGAHSQGTGLGLAIVKQICDNYGFTLSYAYPNGFHTITIHFP